MSTPTDVPLLTAEMADDVNLLSTFGKTRALDVRFALDTIATERARVCPVRSEAEWRAEYQDRAGAWADPRGLSGWLAALRHLNLVAPENGK